MGVITRGIANNVLGTGEIDATDGVNGVIPASNVNNTSFGSVTSLPALAGTITTVAGDPPAPSEGQVWYNSVAGALKYNGFIGAWSAGGNLTTARRGLPGTGTLTATLGIGGNSPTGITGKTEEYDGTSWTEQNDLSTGRAYMAGFGTQTAAAVAGGFVSAPDRFRNDTEEYDGASWTAGGTLTTGRDIMRGTGTQTAGLVFGGFEPGNTGKTEEYNGTSWTESGDLSTARRQTGRAGTQTAALAWGGDTPSGTPTLTDATEEYDGTAWTAGGTLAFAVEGVGSGGTQTSALSAGGNLGAPSLTGNSLQYDGSAWTSTSAMSTARADMGSGAADQTTGVVFGGYTPSTTNVTEEFTTSAANVTISES